MLKIFSICNYCEAKKEPGLVIQAQ